MKFHPHKALACAIAAATVLVAALPAEAGERWRYGRGHHQRPIIVERDNTGDLIAAGILGLAAGALAAGIVSQPQRPQYQPQPVYREPAYRNPQTYPRPSPDRGYYPPAPTRASYSLEPWSAAWYDYCRNRYRSFDARSGTFTGYDGIKRFCVAN